MQSDSMISSFPAWKNQVYKEPIFPQEFAFLRQSNGTMELSPRQTENGIGEQLDFVMLTHDSVNPFSTEVRPRLLILLTFVQF